MADSTATLDPTLASLAKFKPGRESDWAHIERGVPVFLPHDRYEYLDPKTGQRHEQPKFLYSVDEEKLRRIAANMQKRRVQKNVLPVMTIGHRPHKMPEAMDQTKQPPLAGFPTNPRFDYWINEKGERLPAVLADLYYNRDNWEQAKHHPFRSAEYYDGPEIITGVALLKSDPALDMGMTIYQLPDEEFAGEPCYLYAATALTVRQYMADDINPKQPATVQIGDSPSATQTGKTNVDPGPLDRATRQPEPRADYAAMIDGQMSKAKKFAKKHKKAMKKAKRLQEAAKAAGQSYQGVPGATNAFVPGLVTVGKKKKKDKGISAGPEQMQARMDYEQAIVTHKAVLQQLEDAKKQMEQVQYQREDADVERRLTVLETQGVIFKDIPGSERGTGRKLLKERLMRMNNDDRDVEFGMIAQNYERVAQNPVQHYIRTAEINGTRAKIVTPVLQNKARDLAVAHNSNPNNPRMSFKEALDKVMSEV